jgi:hypothetical protein
VGAALLSVTVPVTDVPAVTVELLSERPITSLRASLNTVPSLLAPPFSPIP